MHFLIERYRKDLLIERYRKDRSDESESDWWIRRRNVSVGWKREAVASRFRSRGAQRAPVLTIFLIPHSQPNTDSLTHLFS